MTRMKFLASAICGLGLMTSGAASAVILGGVDFGTGATTHLETTTLAETYINGNGQAIQGYGQVNTVNGNVAYAGTDRLYFVFDNYVSANYTPGVPPILDTVSFTGGSVRMYKLANFNLQSQSSAANIAAITAGQLWLTLSGHTDFSGFTLNSQGQFTGTSISFTGAGLLDVDLTPGTGLADVQAGLDGNSFSDGIGGFADMALTSSANNRVLNQFDNTVGCQTGQAQVGQWCLAGSADIRGDLVPVPEPGLLSLLGVGLLGLVASRRRV